MRALGLMSGTSLDGVDVAVIDTDGERIHGFGPAATYPHAEATREKVRAVFGATSRDPATDAAEAAITTAHIEAVRRFAREEGVELASIDVVGFHGQTITHKPQQGFTWQIGDGRALARALGRPVVADLRSADVAAGGQGAPLVPVFHQALTRDLDLPVAVVNIGGVANVTWIGEDGRLVAFDTGPGNAPIDDWVRRRTNQMFDLDGELAARGEVQLEVVRDFLSSSYFLISPPKSLDRNDFMFDLLPNINVEDGVSTITYCTCLGLSLAEAHFPTPPRTWILCGGGSRNETILTWLGRLVPGRVTTGTAYGWNVEALEAQAFGFLAVRHLRGMPNSYPSTTGASQPIIGGVLHPAEGPAD
ncbi:MAG: anhydro-N-acetylmuramic acid kinase [Alphaproteobacteria bacterium]|nr:anhydro-N-acetylmuramic acid kinase [Alphaproteobacteria bacterium]MCW5740258.1 anhydro-N-acetylmuramic acid kinase [Alphaproteobacteria bacterium]